MIKCKIKQISDHSNIEDNTTKVEVNTEVTRAEATSKITEAEGAVGEAEASTRAGLQVSILRTKVLVKYKTTWVNSHNMAITNK